METVDNSKGIPTPGICAIFVISSPRVWVERVLGFYLKEYGRGDGMSFLLQKTVTSVFLRDTPLFVLKN